jgi:hypothetical protein
MVEQLTLTQLVRGSSPRGGTTWGRTAYKSGGVVPEFCSAASPPILQHSSVPQRWPLRPAPFLGMVSTKALDTLKPAVAGVPSARGRIRMEIPSRWVRPKRQPVREDPSELFGRKTPLQKVENVEVQRPVVDDEVSDRRRPIVSGGNDVHFHFARSSARTPATSASTPSFVVDVPPTMTFRRLGKSSPRSFTSAR